MGCDAGRPPRNRRGSRCGSRCSHVVHLITTTLPLPSSARLHGLGLAAGPGRDTGELGFPRRSRAQRRSPIIVCVAASLSSAAPSEAPPPKAQHPSPHLDGFQIVRRRPRHPRRQRLVSPSSFHHFGLATRSLPALHKPSEGERIDFSNDGTREKSVKHG